jgi:hypothetical protein
MKPLNVLNSAAPRGANLPQKLACASALCCAVATGCQATPTVVGSQIGSRPLSIERQTELNAIRQRIAEASADGHISVDDLAKMVPNSDAILSGHQRLSDDEFVELQFVNLKLHLTNSNKLSADPGVREKLQAVIDARPAPPPPSYTWWERKKLELIGTFLGWPVI